MNNFQHYTNKPGQARLLAEGGTIRAARRKPLTARERRYLAVTLLMLVALLFSLASNPPPAELRSTDFIREEASRLELRNSPAALSSPAAGTFS